MFAIQDGSCLRDDIIEGFSSKEKEDIQMKRIVQLTMVVMLLFCSSSVTFAADDTLRNAISIQSDEQVIKEMIQSFRL